MCAMTVYYLCYYRKQDDIRAADVTGVHTCALPIRSDYPTPNALSIRCGIFRSKNLQLRPGSSRRSQCERNQMRLRIMQLADRSEERRVGKERRARVGY